MFIQGIAFNHTYLLFLGYGYDWNESLGDLYRNGYSTIQLFETPHDESAAEAFPAFVPEKDPAGFVRESADFSPWLFRIIESFIRRDYGIFLANARGIDRKNRKYKPSAALCSAKTSSFDLIAAQIARKNNILVISWQHGAYGMHKSPQALHSELMNSSVHFSWGKEVTEYLEQEPLNHFSPEYVPVGSLMLESEYFSPQAGQDTVFFLYVTTGYLNNMFYVSAPPSLAGQFIMDHPENDYRVPRKIREIGTGKVTSRIWS